MLYVVLIALALWVLLVVLEVQGIIWLYASFADWANQNLNLSDEFSVLLAAMLTAAALPLFSYVVSFLFLGRHKIKVSLLAVAATGIATALLLAFGQDVFFLPDGTPLRCYVATPDGIKITRRRASAECPIDKTYSVRYAPMTREIVYGVLAARKGVKPAEIDPETFDGKYFDVANLRALVWYREQQDGTYDLYNGAGFHPRTGEPLLPVLSTDQSRLRSIDAFIELRKAQVAERIAAEARAIIEQRIAREKEERERAESAKRRAAEIRAAAEQAEALRLRQKLSEDNQRDLAEAEAQLSVGSLLRAKSHVSAVLARSPHDPDALELYSKWNLDDVCSDCGVIWKIEETKIEGKGSKLATVAGAATGGAAGAQMGGDVGTAVGVVVAGVIANKVWRWATTKKAYAVSVRMDSGRTESLLFAKQPQMSVGDRVIVVPESNGDVRLAIYP